jgi:hypothetical protein
MALTFQVCGGISRPINPLPVAILRTKRRGSLRNICVALGNAGDVSTLPALSQAAKDSEPLIAEHARWAGTNLRHPPSSIFHLRFPIAADSATGRTLQRQERCTTPVEKAEKWT